MNLRLLTAKTQTAYEKLLRERGVSGGFSLVMKNALHDNTLLIIILLISPSLFPTIFSPTPYNVASKTFLHYF
jgi:hypothetical protein